MNIVADGRRSPTTDGMATLGEIVKQQRDARGWTQAELAKRSGLSLAALTKLEQGAAENPRWSTLVAIADALGVSLDTFRGARPDAPGGAGGAA